MAEPDPRLDRLYDYTKFHIGVYLLAAGALITVAGSSEIQKFLSLGSLRLLLPVAVVAMLIAGMAGGIIASSCAVARNFDDVWNEKIGPWKWRWMDGSKWATLEHGAFWLSAVLIALAVLLGGDGGDRGAR